MPITLIPGNHDYELAAYPEYVERLAEYNATPEQEVSIERTVGDSLVHVEHGIQEDPNNRIPDFGNPYANPPGYFLKRLHRVDPLLGVLPPVYRNTARVPRGHPKISDFRDHENLRFSNDLTPRVNRVSYMTHSTVVRNTVATWINDRSPKQLPAVARKCGTSHNAAGAGETGVVGRGGAADPHGRGERSGGNSSRPISGRARGIKFACDGTTRLGTCGQDGEASEACPRGTSHVMLPAQLLPSLRGRRR